MRYTVRTSVVDVIGYLWMPNTEAAQRYTLSDYDLGAVTDVDGNVTRDSLRAWVDTNTGDFSNVVDFSASLELPAGPLPPVPADFPVRPLEANDPAQSFATCGTCNRSWDDGMVTDWTPTPAARCPFEYFHGEPERTLEIPWGDDESELVYAECMNGPMEDW